MNAPNSRAIQGVQTYLAEHRMKRFEAWKAQVDELVAAADWQEEIPEIWVIKQFNKGLPPKTVANIVDSVIESRQLLAGRTIA